MEERKLIAFRMLESARDDLKLMAMLEKRNMGELLEELIQERLEKMQRISLGLSVGKPGALAVGTGERVQEAEKVGSVRQGKNKRGRR